MHDFQQGVRLQVDRYAVSQIIGYKRAQQGTPNPDSYPVEKKQGNLVHPGVLYARFRRQKVTVDHYGCRGVVVTWVTNIEALGTLISDQMYMQTQAHTINVLLFSQFSKAGTCFCAYLFRSYIVFPHPYVVGQPPEHIVEPALHIVQIVYYTLRR